MKKSLYIISILIVLALGILIGLNINNKSRNNEANVSKSNNIINNKEPINSNENSNLENNSNIIKSDESKTNESNNIPNEIVYSVKDKEVIETLEATLNEIKTSKESEEFSKKAKKTFIDIVDFLFYNGKIKNTTFNELTDNGKAKVLELANKIDEAIEAKIPNYKEDISSKASESFKSASNLIKKGSSNLNDFLKEKLSDEHYNAIIDSKEDLVKYSKNALSYVKDNGSKLFSTIKDKLSEWYNNFKSNNS